MQSGLRVISSSGLKRGAGAPLPIFLRYEIDQQGSRRPFSSSSVAYLSRLAPAEERPEVVSDIHASFASLPWMFVRRDAREAPASERGAAPH